MPVDLESVCGKCHDFCPERVGDSFSRTFRFQDDAGDPLDFSGYTGASEIRSIETNALLASFTVTPGPLDATGEITLALTPAQTEVLGEGVFAYDVAIENGAATIKRTLIFGALTLCEDVTG